MVVEFLTFDVPLSERPEWLENEEQHWSRFLEEQSGFVNKQMWEDADDQSVVHAVIWWESIEHWHGIPQDKLDAVMEAMGVHERQATLSTFNLIRDC